jgi:signal transduction histidine kinase
MNKHQLSFGISFFIIFIIVVVGFMSFFSTIPSGHVGVGSMFGKVKSDIYSEGIHWVNPFLKMTLFDARQKTHKESMGVPSKDQLITEFELSIQYRLIKEKAPFMFKETGTPKEVINVHMIPLLRSQMREIGKSVEKAEQFYDQSVQKRIQEELLSSLLSLAEKGIKVEKLLIREVILPKIITNAVIRKKEAAQAAEKAKEELKKFKVDQERKEAQAEQKNIDIHLQGPQDISIYADKNMLNVIIRNLVSNALKFTPDGGNVTLSAQERENKIYIKIEDTGIGIPEDTLPNLFRLDKKTSTTGTAGESGSGLGLPLCKDMIEKHNGTIQVSSTEGKGSSFELTFPEGGTANGSNLEL